jgi:hypothetical protein
MLTLPIQLSDCVFDIQILRLVLSLVSLKLVVDFLPLNLRSKPILSICRSCFVQCLRRFVNEPGGSSSLYSTFRPHADLSLATVIHSLAVLFKAELEGNYVSVSYGLLRSPYWSCRRTPCAKHSPGDLDSSIEFESHRHLRVSINVSIVGEFATIPLTCSFVIRFSATSHIVSPHILRRHPWWKASSLDLSVFQCPAFAPRVLYSQQSLDRACDGYRSVYFLLPSNCLFMEPNSFSPG